MLFAGVELHDAWLNTLDKVRLIRTADAGRRAPTETSNIAIADIAMTAGKGVITAARVRAVDPAAKDHDESKRRDERTCTDGPHR